jgi:methionyl-tRNA formyltransferase
MRLVFFGTADFAVPCLEALVSAGHDVAAVVTAPDKPAGRGYALSQSPVKQCALRLGLLCLQPEKLKNEGFLAQLKELAPTLQVVVAFRMLPEVVWAAPPLGTINVHGSLLPQYRGAAPIHWAVINGEAETGVTTFFLRHEIDTGDLIYQERTAIGPDETTGQVYERLMHLGAALLVKTVAAIESGNAPRLPQNLAQELHHAPKITSENSVLNPTLSAEEVRNFIRGMNPAPGAWMRYNGLYMKVFEGKHLPPDALPDAEAEPGTLAAYRNKLCLRCGDTWLELTQVQPEGKRKMAGSEFVNGAGRKILGLEN